MIKKRDGFFQQDHTDNIMKKGWLSKEEEFQLEKLSKEYFPDFKIDFSDGGDGFIIYHVCLSENRKKSFPALEEVENFISHIKSEFHKKFFLMKYFDSEIDNDKVLWFSVGCTENQFKELNAISEKYFNSHSTYVGENYIQMDVNFAILNIEILQNVYNEVNQIIELENFSKLEIITHCNYLYFFTK